MYSAPSHIQPDTQEDRDRWSEQALRYRLLTGAHIEDLRDELRRLFAREIAADLEFHPDMSRNPLRMIVQQLANLYAEPPKVHTEDRELDLSAIVTARLWSLQQQTERLTLGINEAVVRVDWEWWRGATEATYRPISPDLIVARPDPSRPDQPIAVEELRPRVKPGTYDKVWTWDVYDISDPDAPVFRIDAISNKGARYDATAEYAPDLVGSYPYMYEGAPVLLACGRTVTGQSLCAVLCGLLPCGLIGATVTRAVRILNGTRWTLTPRQGSPDRSAACLLTWYPLIENRS